MTRKMQIPLDSRLALCASFVRKGTRLADIGTDHAYLPVSLAACGAVCSAVASDIRKGPLENARANIIRFGVEDKVRTVLCDGLDGISPDDALDIVIAGMGGELIAAMIKRTPWVYDSSRRLILQPMTRAGALRAFLCAEGFEIIDEKACVSGRKCYSVMLCVYDGKVRECDSRYEYLGRLAEDSSDEAVRYAGMIKGKLKRKINGLIKSGDSVSAEIYKKILQELENVSGEETE